MHHREKDRKNRFLELLEKEPARPAPCPHVAEGCGGCLLQEYDYVAQLRAKEAYLLEQYGVKVSVVGCAQPLGYRNRMDFVTAFGKTGLRQRGRFAQVVDIKDCLLLPAHAREAHRIARNILADAGVKDYNYVRHEGFMRYLVIRTSHSTKETMLIATTAAPKNDDETANFQKILTTVAGSTTATSVHWTRSDGIADQSVGAPFWHTGQEHIIDEIAGKRFRIFPRTFFQANTELIGELFGKAVSFCHGNVLDLYCGVGVLSVLAASVPGVERVTGVEINADSVASAKDNLALNNVSTVSFVCADAAVFLKDAGKFDTVICDPARPGLGKEACVLLLSLAPERIVYISCNPLSHNDDLAILKRQYDVESLEAYDLFPQTPHLEVLSVLRCRDRL